MPDFEQRRSCRRADSARSATQFLALYSAAVVAFAGAMTFFTGG